MRVGAIGPVAVLVARMADPGPLPPLIAAQAVAPLLAAPTLVLAAAALGRRMWITGGTTAAAGLALAGLLVPELAGSPSPSPIAGAPLRVFSANVHYGNADSGAMAGEITAADPDVVVLLELSPTNEPPLSSALADYPYRIVLPNQGAFGVGLWSKLPVSGDQLSYVDELPLLRVQLTVAGRQVEVYAVHTVSPTTRTFAGRWRRQLADLAERVRSGTGPVVVTGDFNATRDHRPFRQLLDAGLADAHDLTGGGWAPTWPRGAVAPPFLRLDHLLVGRGVGVVRTGRADGAGSDHRPLVAVLAVPPA